MTKRIATVLLMCWASQALSMYLTDGTAGTFAAGVVDNLAELHLPQIDAAPADAHARGFLWKSADEEEAEMDAVAKRARAEGLAAGKLLIEQQKGEIEELRRKNNALNAQLNAPYLTVPGYGSITTSGIIAGLTVLKATNVHKKFAHWVGVQAIAYPLLAQKVASNVKAEDLQKAVLHLKEAKDATLPIIKAAGEVMNDLKALSAFFKSDAAETTRLAPLALMALPAGLSLIKASIATGLVIAVSTGTLIGFHQFKKKVIKFIVGNATEEAKNKQEKQFEVKIEKVTNEYIKHEDIILKNMQKVLEANKVELEKTKTELEKVVNKQEKKFEIKLEDQRKEFTHHEDQTVKHLEKQLTDQSRKTVEIESQVKSQAKKVEVMNTVFTQAIKEQNVQIANIWEDVHASAEGRPLVHPKPTGVAVVIDEAEKKKHHGGFLNPKNWHLGHKEKKEKQPKRGLENDEEGTAPQEAPDSPETQPSFQWPPWTQGRGW